MNSWHAMHGAARAEDAAGTPGTSDASAGGRRDEAATREAEAGQVQADTAATRRDIVVIGASAGGVEALQTLVAGLPAALPASVFVVLHIPPHAPSRLHEVLARPSPLPVVAARDGAPILPGHIHVAVADRHLALEGDRIRTPRGPRENCARPAIDVLFRSAAYGFGPRVVGVVLTGNLDDGTAGLWAVKDRGGVGLVQSPEEAPYPGMPQSALRHVAVDRVLPIAAMAGAIAEFTSERAAPPQPATVTEPMAAELAIALGHDALRSGSMQIGSMVPHTCPECHGSLRAIHEGPIVRYRCHTGHAYSLQALFAQNGEAIDNALWNALRAIDERILLLRSLERQARTAGDGASADRYAAQVGAAEQWGRQVRDMVLDAELRGLHPAAAPAAQGRPPAAPREPEPPGA